VHQENIGFAFERFDAFRVASDASAALLSAKACDSRQQARKGSKSAPSKIDIFLMLCQLPY